MKAIWKGSIGFGLVNIPIKLYTATQSSTLDLDMLDRRDKARIRFERVNENTHKEVAWNDIVKGYLYNDDYVVLDDDDFAEAAPEKSKLISINEFVSETEIDTLLFENAYFIEPEKAGTHAYALLCEALQKSGKVGVATFVLRTAEIFAIIKPRGNALILNKMRFAEEVRSMEELNIPQEKAKPAELKMALILIDQVSGKFDSTKYKNDYAEHLLKIIKSKAGGKRRGKVRKITEATGKTQDLLQQLKASLETGKKRAS